MTVKKSLNVVTVGIMNVDEQVRGEWINSVHGMFFKKNLQLYKSLVIFKLN
jgi:c-di-AMP phosphodiesterase-like protein